MKIKYMVTGCSGFVGRHFLNYLETQSIECSVLGIDIALPDFKDMHFVNVEFSAKIVNLLDRSGVKQALEEFHPDYIIHLAAFSSVSYSWQFPDLSFANNTTIFLNLLEEVRQTGIQCRILSVGSSEEYGIVDSAEMPITEGMKLRPVSPYAVARVAQEMLTRVYVDGFGMDIVLTRSFNHIGIWQKDIFVIPSFARQLVSIKKSGLKSGILKTGDVSIIRDFVDVRDVVRAYDLLLKHGQKGEVYNVCSGTGKSLQQMIEMMAIHLQIEAQIDVDPTLVRPSDNPVVIGSYEKLTNATGWKPEISLESTIREVVKYWSEQIK